MRKPDSRITVYLLSANRLGGLESASWLGILDQQDLGRIEQAGSKRRNEFLLSRLLLRYALSRHLDGVDPAALEVVENASGQPEVPRADQSGLRFNISHSHHYVVVAVSTDIDDGIGVDIEYRGRHRPITGIAHAFCSDQELAEIRPGTKTGDEAVQLYTLWTRKEAVLKSRGQGLGKIPMKQIRFESAPAEPAPDARQTPLTVSSGVLGDYCLSIATSQPFRLAIEEIRFRSASRSLASRPRDSSEFTTIYTLLQETSSPHPKPPA